MNTTQEQEFRVEEIRSLENFEIFVGEKSMVIQFYTTKGELYMTLTITPDIIDKLEAAIKKFKQV